VRRLRLLLLFFITAGGTGGCVFLPQQTGADDAEPITHGNIIPPSASVSASLTGTAVTAPAHTCPPPGAQYRVRDLTRPWRERAYLLPDGATCRPGGSL